MTFFVEGRQGYIVTGSNQQSVNICQQGKRRGDGQQYCDWIIYIPRPHVVTDDECGRFQTVAKLLEWLRNHKNGQVAVARNADKDIIDPVQPETGVAQPPSGLNQPAADQHVIHTDNNWEAIARLIVEAAIDELVEDFVVNPCLHRVEHSIHCELFRLLTSHRHLNHVVPFCDGLGATQLVHKEWPETVARPNQRRGNWDIAILSPKRVREATREGFRKGMIVPSFVIELGLDYDHCHLSDDASKLVNSLTLCQQVHSREIAGGYLVHLVREEPECVELNRVLACKHHPQIKTAFGSVRGHETTFTLLRNSVDDAQA